MPKNPVFPRTQWGWGRPSVPKNEVLGFRSFDFTYVFAVAVALPALFLFYFLNLNFTFITFLLEVVLAVLLFLPVLCVFLYVHCRVNRVPGPVDQSLITFKDREFEAKWKGRKIPIMILYDSYFAGKFDVKGDLLEALYQRGNFADFVFTWGHIVYFLTQLIPEALKHTKIQDVDQVRDHYDRGNDFYGAFLGETMIYTSGIFNSFEETLEQAQYNKLDLVLNKIHAQKGDKHLDIGCGWGTLCIHAAKNYGTDSTGVTLAKEQTSFAMDRIQKAGVKNNARILCMDYRDIPQAKYDKITCLEMAEHVGVKYFQKFMRQVYDLLEDDGIFYLQIAGLRRAWQHEDLMWGCFMGKYVFPGADASCPLGWVVNQAEAAGFEVHSVETVGIHYSATIKRWYDNWQKNKSLIVNKYGQEWFRKWEWFLGWSVISPENGMATCYQLVMHKNRCDFDRKTYIGERKAWKI